MKTDRNFVTILLLNIVTCGIYGFVFVASMLKDINILCDGDGKTCPTFGRYFLLTILTCGIYSMYTYYVIGERLAEAGKRYGIEVSIDGTKTLLIMILGSALCGVGPFIVLYMQVKALNDLSFAYNSKKGAGFAV